MSENTVLTNADASTSKPTISVSANLLISGQPVPVTSQDIANIASNGFQFSLSEPVVLGTLKDLITWINSQFQTKIDYNTISTDVNKIPITAIKDVLNTALGASLSVEVLKINTKTNLFEISILMKANEPPKILGVLQIESLGFGIKHIGKST